METVGLTKPITDGITPAQGSSMTVNNFMELSFDLQN